MTSERPVWILGAENQNADKSIPWDASNLSNLSDPDVLIINLQSLNKYILGQFHDDITKRRTLEEDIQSKLHSGGTIIFITAPIIGLESKASVVGSVPSLTPKFSNYFLSPTTVWTVDVPEGKIMRYDKNRHPFKNFLQQVKKFNFYLDCGNPGTHYKMLEEYLVSDNSRHMLSFALEVNEKMLKDCGKAIYLPPPTQVSVEEAIDSILEVYGKSTPKEIAPGWVSNLSLPGLSDIDSEILNLNKELQDLHGRIQIMEKRRQSLLDHFRLLYAKDKPLENAVYDALKILGIENVAAGRAPNLEDWVFKFKTLHDFDYAVIEVKGADHRTSQANISQADKWVSEYFGEKNVLAKGVFIPNQHRLCPYPVSTNDRLYFHPNELRFAVIRNICIIPSCVLFESIGEALKGKPPARNTLEKVIMESKGLLTKL